MNAKNKIVLISLFLFQNHYCHGQTNSDYPVEVLKLGKTKLYDKAKWFIYCIQSDRKVRFLSKTGIKTNITYGTLPLKFENLQLRGDTLEINFNFYYKGEVVDKLTDNYPHRGAVYIGNSGKIVMYTTNGHARYVWAKCDNPAKCIFREEKPLQPEVIRYIKANKNKLDPWFRKEAIKRGVIKETLK